jgi:hypothetical protein
MSERPHTGEEWWRPDQIELANDPSRIWEKRAFAIQPGYSIKSRVADCLPDSRRAGRFQKAPLWNPGPGIMSTVRSASKRSWRRAVTFRKGTRMGGIGCVRSVMGSTLHQVKEGKIL